MWILLALQVTAVAGEWAHSPYYGWANLGTFATQEQCNAVAKQLGEQKTSVRAFVCAASGK